MTIEDILKLKEAGFTSEEISNLANVTDTQPAERADIHPAAEQTDYTPFFEDVKTTIINEFKTLFLNANQGANEQSNAQSVDDILINHFNGGNK